MLEHQWEVEFCHSYREGNRATDAMAAYAYLMDMGLIFHPYPPTNVAVVIEDDFHGVGSIRAVAG
ncbi:ribonuclease H [Senna tora]|uniref:Ribonuclease H n=1 Tax=Senna tora TaxID=362788 RepID=A0A834SPA0_9FABA|nr:ribonuclease H [Senna tora]